MIINAGPKLEIELPRQSNSRTGMRRGLADVEREHIENVLESTHWRVRGAGGAAEILEVKPTTLEARMKKLKIKRPD